MTETTCAAITPVLLVGARRSGTTLFRLMFDGHPDVAWERGWEFAVDLINSRGEVLTHHAALRGVSSAERSKLRDYLDQKAREALGKKKVLGVTIHVGFHKAPILWENAKYIHIIRDPRDIAISSIKLGWSGSYYYAPDMWIDAERKWEEMQSTLSGDAWIDLRYEDFVTNPKCELAKICEFLQVEYSEKLFDYIETSKYSYPRKTLAYRWKEQIGKAEIQLIEARVGDMLVAHGYEPSVFRPIKVGWLTAISLGLKNFLGIKAKGIKDEGFWLYMLGLIGRKIGFRVALRLHRKITQTKKQDLRNELEKKY
jgi:hypothetical protein